MQGTLKPCYCSHCRHNPLSQRQLMSTEEKSHSKDRRPKQRRTPQRRKMRCDRLLSNQRSWRRYNP